jgi:hypothetical protein
MSTVKVLQLGAFQLEAGQAGAGQSPGWGQTGSEETLGANDGFPYINFQTGSNVDHAEDNSITSNAFKDVPRQTGITVERPLSMYNRFQGMGRFLFWMFGFENSVIEVAVFRVNTPTVEPTADATYYDGDGTPNTYTFLRKETSSGTDYWIFRADDGAVPSAATGTLTKDTGTGDATLSYTACSSLMYEHLYELDAHERHLTAYRTAEQITGYSAGDKKNRMATLGIKMHTNDYRYRNAMCNGFSFSSESGQLAELSTGFVSFDENRGDHSSASWTIPSNLQSSDNIVAHHQTSLEIGTAEGSLTALACSALGLDVGIPLQIIQSTVSGLYIAEPIFEGKYEIGQNVTLARHSVDTYMGYRDNWTTALTRMSATYGYYMQEILIQQAKVKDSLSDDDVPKENLEIIPGYTSSNNWSSWLHGNTLVQNSPIVMRVRDDDSQNYMFSI